MSFIPYAIVGHVFYFTLTIKLIIGQSSLMVGNESKMDTIVVLAICLNLIKYFVMQVKDQTYFLSHLSQSQLKRLLFPLGCMRKVI